MADKDSRSGVVYFTTDVLAYTDELHHPHDLAMQRAFDAATTDNLPAIQVSRADGALLEMLVCLAGGTTAVEVGTLAGYSTIHLARALGPTGVVHTIEMDPHHASVARRRFEDAGVAGQVHLHVGRALDVLPTLVASGPFDIVFLDADKGSYDAYGDWAFDNLRPGGLLLADNAFLFGRLMDASDDAAAMRRFHSATAARFKSVCVTTPDGLVVARKPL